MSRAPWILGGGPGVIDGAPENAFYVGLSRPRVFLSLFVPRSAAHRISI
jgi:hypothetical protein